MHCMIAWGVANGGAPLSSNDHEFIMGAFEGEDRLFVFPGVAVVTLADDTGRLALQQKLTEVSKDRLGSRAVFVMSPLMAPGTGIYRGFLPQTIWEPLNKKTV